MTEPELTPEHLERALEFLALEREALNDNNNQKENDQ